MWDMKFVLTLIGLLLVLEGLPYAASPESMQKWLRQLAELPPIQLRTIGLVSMILGFAFLFFVRHSGLLP
jgi:uncharacterized protein YjeT (DUF2065 family)